MQMTEEKYQANPSADKILNSNHRRKHEMKHHALKSSLNILVELTKMTFR